MIVERITSPESLDRYARILGERWKEYVEVGLGPALLGSGLIVGARSESGESFGVGWATRTKDPRTLYFAYIYVSETCRHKHVATLLDEELCRLAVEDGAYWGFGLAETWNLKSNMFLRRQGWVLLGTAENCYWRGDATHLYFKNLLATKRRPPARSPFWSIIYSLIQDATK